MVAYRWTACGDAQVYRRTVDDGVLNRDGGVYAIALGYHLFHRQQLGISVLS
ncbi:hypothetical protein KCP77_22040 [Salmonella enterica subsp. enterica]|nr:hypothetical protein KCP77_22040 [Salmonella enterica subsp. enterica]